MKFCLPVLICFFSLFNLQNLFAQKIFEPGYIVTSGKDTLHGFVGYRNWSKNPTKIDFKKSFWQKATKYGLSQISGFSVHGEIYVKAVVTLNVSSDKVSLLSDSPVPTLEKDTVFLTTAVSGIKSLFYLNDKNGKLQLYIKEDGQYILLDYYRFRAKSRGKLGIAVDDGFKDQLVNYLGPCAKVADRTTYLRYTVESVEYLVKTYYRECATVQPTYTRKLEKLLVQSGILAGASLTNVQFVAETYPLYFPDPKFPSVIGPTAGAYLNLAIPKTWQKLLFHNELAFTSFKLRSQFTQFNNERDYSNFDVTMGYTYLKLNTMLRYKFSVASVGVFVNAGVSNGFIVSETNKRIKETVFYSETKKVTEQKALPEERKYETGFLAGLGVSFGRISLECRFERSNGMSGYTGYVPVQSPVRRGFLLLGFGF